MTDRDGNRSNPYKPDPEKCCEACVFDRGEHAPYCRLNWKRVFAETEREIREFQQATLATYGVPCMACALGRDDHAEWCNAVAHSPCVGCAAAPCGNEHSCRRELAWRQRHDPHLSARPGDGDKGQDV